MYAQIGSLLSSSGSIQADIADCKEAGNASGTKTATQLRKKPRRSCFSGMGTSSTSSRKDCHSSSHMAAKRFKSMDSRGGTNSATSSLAFLQCRIDIAPTRLALIPCDDKQPLIETTFSGQACPRKRFVGCWRVAVGLPVDAYIPAIHLTGPPRSAVVGEDRTRTARSPAW